MRDYELHFTNYVMTHFRHLMTDVEPAARDAVVLNVVHADGSYLSVTLREGTSSAAAQKVHEALRDGAQVFRRRTRERIAAAYPAG